MIFHFDALPLHPPPEQFESFTSYLTRLAEINKIESTTALAAICLPHQNPKGFNRQKDLPPPTSFEHLMRATTCTEEVLRKTTFHYVGDNLGRTAAPETLHAFLARSVAQCLCYCSMCLIENPYYRLPWRFLTLYGCHKHACLLLNGCGYCGCTIPIFSPLLKIGLCPKCKGDLRKCCSRALTELQNREVMNAQQCLEFLLSPHAWKSSGLTRSIALGQKYSTARREKQLMLKEVSQHIGISVRTLQSVELAQGRNNTGASFDVYCNYARYLNISIFECYCEILERVDTEQEKVGRGKGAYDEGSVVERVLEAVKQLKSCGKRLTQKNISSAVKIHISLLYEYPNVKAIMQKCVDDVEEEKRKLCQINEEKLFERVVEAINLLEGQGIPISYSSVGKMLGSHRRTFHKHPRIKSLLQQKANYYQRQFARTAQREEDLLTAAANAVQQLKEKSQRITGESIRNILGLSQSNLGRYPSVRQFLEGYSPRQAQMRKMYARQEELLPKVQAAIQSLKKLGQPVTRSAIAGIIGISPTNLDAYPEILLIVREAVGNVWKGYGREQLEGDILRQVEAALQRLKERGSPITKQTISKESSVNLSRLEGYSGVKTAIESAIADYWSVHRRERNENILLFEAQITLKWLEEMGQSITREAIAQSIGLSTSSLYHYPRIVAYIKEPCKEARKKNHNIDFQLKEDLLARKALAATSQLLDRKEPITKKAVSRIVGISVAALNYYPRVKSILEKAITSCSSGYGEET